MRFSHLTWPTALILLLFISWTAQLASYSDGPPSGRTGAPGELTCYNGSCHNSFPLNSGPGLASISIDAPSDGYIPDSTYSLRAHVSHPSMLRFGFELIPYSPQLDASAGLMTLPQSANGIEIITEGDREYVRHNDATEASDSTDWLINWTAPAAGTGDIVFHAAYVASNFNGNRQGDYVYTTNLTIPEGDDTLSTHLIGLPHVSDLRVFSHTTHIRLHLKLDQTVFLEISLRNMKGQQVYHLQDTASPGPYQTTLSVPHLPAGIYLLHLRHRYGQHIQKILIR